MTDKKIKDSGLNDSGRRAESKDGAQYEPRELGGRYDLIPAYILAEFFTHTEDYIKFPDTASNINYIYKMVNSYAMTDDYIFVWQKDTDEETDIVDTYALYLALAAAMQLTEKYYNKGKFDGTYTHTLHNLAILYEKGAIKYCSRNWEKGLEQSRRYNSLNRHIHKFNIGMEDEDHAAAIVWNIIALIYYHRMPEYRDLK